MKKQEVKKIKPKATTQLNNFEFETIVSTGAFSNVKAIIKIKAKDVNEAISLSVDPVRKMHENFFLLTEKRQRVAEVDSVEKKPQGMRAQTNKTSAPTEDNTQTYAFNKASNAIAGALTQDALDVILGQIDKSVKLTDDEKGELTTQVLLKKKSLNE